jgi:4-hydroxy-3-methylbut-2-enyl diphosphate reductase IspH
LKTTDALGQIQMVTVLSTKMMLVLQLQVLQKTTDVLGQIQMVTVSLIKMMLVLQFQVFQNTTDVLSLRQKQLRKLKKNSKMFISISIKRQSKLNQLQH